MMDGNTRADIYLMVFACYAPIMNQAREHFLQASFANASNGQEKTEIAMGATEPLIVRCRVGDELLRLALESGSRVKVIVFGSGVEISPKFQYVDLAMSDTEAELSYNVQPEREGAASLRVELIDAGNEALDILDKKLTVVTAPAEAA
jgi:hypothetical protein